MKYDGCIQCDFCYGVIKSLKDNNNVQYIKDNVHHIDVCDDKRCLKQYIEFLKNKCCNVK